LYSALFAHAERFFAPVLRFGESGYEHKRAQRNSSMDETPESPPFTPAEMERLRRGLRRLRDSGLATEKLLNKVFGKEASKWPLQRPTLDKWITETVKVSQNPDALISIWRYLLKDKDYGWCLNEKPTGSLDETTTEKFQELPPKPGTFEYIFRPDLGTRHSYTDKYVVDRFPGNYVMYRPDMRPVNVPRIRPTGLVRVSAVEVWREGSTVMIREIQDFPDSEFSRGHKQHNAGPLFAYGKFVNFIMRGEGNWSLKVGIVEKTQGPENGRLSWFSGRLFVASDQGIFPVVLFICVRTSEQPVSGVLPPEAIKDQEAVAYLRDVNYGIGKIDWRRFVYRRPQAKKSPLPGKKKKSSSVKKL
jgi:hypothetical protein